MIRHCLSILRLGLLVVTLAGGMALAQGPAGDAGRGKDMFGKKYMCYTCHGWDGHGGSGAVLAGLKLNQAGFNSYVRKGGAGSVGVGGRMPAYTTKTVPEQDLADIFAYLKTLPEPPAAKSIPALTQILSQN
jgi:mono/diheme cytochrome c family protein